MNTIDYAKIDEQINKHVGIGKQFETAQKALDYCNSFINALGPVAAVGGGVWGIKFCFLIPELEERIRQGE